MSSDRSGNTILTTDVYTIQLYHLTYRVLTSTYRLFITLHSLARACFAGFWLGLLRQETLLSIDRMYYSDSEKYSDGSYNRSGLWSWEKALLTRYFQHRRRLLVVGAGGGREILALWRLGYEADGIECNPELVRVANALLEEEGLPASVHFAPPDTCPRSSVRYDGLIIGWGAYMLIQGRAKRVALLRSMHAQARPGTPVLVSFFFRSPTSRRFFIIAAIGNALRQLLGRERLEVGDDLEPEYVHYFTKEELAAELQEGGFGLEYYSEDGYGHAVGVAV